MTTTEYKDVCLFWSERFGWSSEIPRSPEELIHFKSFGDFAGHSKVAVTVPDLAFEPERIQRKLDDNNESR